MRSSEKEARRRGARQERKLAESRNKRKLTEIRGNNSQNQADRKSERRTQGRRLMETIMRETKKGLEVSIPEQRYTG